MEHHRPATSRRPRHHYCTKASLNAAISNALHPGVAPYSPCFTLIGSRDLYGTLIAWRLERSSLMQQGELCSILCAIATTFSHVGIIPDNATSQRVFSRISCFPHPCIPTLLHTHFTSVLKIPMLRYSLHEVYLVVVLTDSDVLQEDRPDVYSLHVTSHIQYRYASTVVSSRVANTANHSREVFFSFVMPDTAFITGFLIHLQASNGRMTHEVPVNPTTLCDRWSSLHPANGHRCANSVY
ncbi:hypothetical protein PR048_028377 [Dryococelus australis]|uniref:VIT domain-containing protein n=1 Tax=Dryococelus australis TaxID=614101 RepID=A0ABQ9GJ52_9NEOP|nr:hypothetical protein PR048_028377 [Dryococelus australis]